MVLWMKCSDILNQLCQGPQDYLEQISTVVSRFVTSWKTLWIWCFYCNSSAKNTLHVDDLVWKSGLSTALHILIYFRVAILLLTPKKGSKSTRSRTRIPLKQPQIGNYTCSLGICYMLPLLTILGHWSIRQVVRLCYHYRVSFIPLGLEKYCQSPWLMITCSPLLSTFFVYYLHETYVPGCSSRTIQYDAL